MSNWIETKYGLPKDDQHVWTWNGEAILGDGFCAGVVHGDGYFISERNTDGRRKVTHWHSAPILDEDGYGVVPSPPNTESKG